MSLVPAEAAVVEHAVVVVRGVANVVVEVSVAVRLLDRFLLAGTEIAELRSRSALAGVPDAAAPSPGREADAIAGKYPDRAPAEAEVTRGLLVAVAACTM